MTLRILHMADVLPTPNSGAAGTDYQGVLALERAGHQVRAVWSDELSHRISHYSSRYLLELPCSYRRAMLRHMKVQAFDVVQVSQPYGFLAAKALADGGSSAVFVHRSHGFEPRVRDDLAIWHRQYPEHRNIHRRLASALMSRLLERHNRLIARYADGHLVSASQCAAHLQRVYGVPPARVGLIPQAVSDTYVAGARPVDSSRLQRLLYVGQYAFVKAPMVLGSVVSQVLAQRPECSFTWVCSACHHAQALAHFAAGIRDRVILVESMPQDQLIKVYDHHGVFLFPSFFEGFGKAFLEAMSRGLVVVAADNGGMRDIITHGLDGLKVATGDVAGMVHQVEAVLSNQAMAAALSARAILTASHLTWDQFASASTSFYEQLIVQKARQATGFERAN